MWSHVEQEGVGETSEVKVGAGLGLVEGLDCKFQEDKASSLLSAITSPSVWHIVSAH